MTIDPNVEGEITLRVQPDGYCDINVCFDSLSYIEKESQNIPIVKKVTILPEGKQIVFLDISDYYQGTFLSVGLLDNGSVSIYVATEYIDLQYSAYVLIESLNPLVTNSLVDSYVQFVSRLLKEEG